MIGKILNRKKVIILGSSGYIGSFLSSKLKEKYQVKPSKEEARLCHCPKGEYNTAITHPWRQTYVGRGMQSVFQLC